MSEIKTEKQRFQPWNEQEKEELEHTILDLEIQRIEKEQQIAVLTVGRKDVDIELTGTIAEAKKQVKAAKLQLIELEHDQANDLTIKRLKYRHEEAKREAVRLANNAAALKKQMAKGKPVLENKKEAETDVKKS